MAEFENNNQSGGSNSPDNYARDNNAAYDADGNASYNNNPVDTGSTNPAGRLPDYSFYAEQLQADNQASSGQGSSYYGAGFYYHNQNQTNNQGAYYQSQHNSGVYQQQAGANGYQSQQQGAYQQSGSFNYNPQTGAGYQSNQHNSGQYYNNINNIPYGNYYNQYYNAGNKPTKKDRKPGRFVKALQFVAKALCFGLIAAAGFFGFHKLYSYINPNSSVERYIDALGSKDGGYELSYTKAASITVSDASIVSDVIEKNLPAIVSITSITTENNWFGQSFEVPGSGSGIIVGKTEKEILVATNNHVVQGAGKITITFVDGSEADAIIKGSDVAADLAVVALNIDDIPRETLDKISVAKLGNSDEVKVGELAIAIGNALGYGQSATVGYISAKDREVEVSDGYLKTKKMILLQTDAAINPGNSGGALLNSKGEVIGINSVKYAKEEVEGMGFAIPISTAIPIINELMSREILREEEQGFLGISGGDVTEDASEAYNMPVGVFVNSVVEGGPADKAGLQQGDIIIKVDDIKITSISQLREYVNSRRVGTDVRVTYMHYENGQYKENTVTVTLGKNPNLK